MSEMSEDLSKLEFEFDLNGFTIVRSFLTDGQVRQMNSVISEKTLEQMESKFQFIEFHKAFYDLLFHPDVLAICDRWIGPQFRFDHAWGVHYPPDSTGAQENLHAGPYQNQGFFHYNWHDNRPRTSCIVFAYVLQDQKPDDGGLVLLPGSHKLNYPLGQYGASGIIERFYAGNLSSITTLNRPALQKGDLLIMAEATIHGTEQWLSKTDWRRNLYYKYCYGFMGWLPHDNDVAARLRSRASTELERRVLDVPYVATRSGNIREWRRSVLPQRS